MCQLFQIFLTAFFEFPDCLIQLRHLGLGLLFEFRQYALLRELAGLIDLQESNTLDAFVQGITINLGTNAVGDLCRDFDLGLEI
jgi:hypothetical protein